MACQRKTIDILKESTSKQIKLYLELIGPLHQLNNMAPISKKSDKLPFRENNFLPVFLFSVYSSS